MADKLVIDLVDAGIQQALTRAADRLGDLSPLMESIGMALQQNIQLRLDLKVDPTGQPWAPLAQSTRDRYAAADKGRKQGSLLVRTGMMRASLGHNASRADVEIGFGEPYAGYHETGSKDGTLPRRALLTANWQTGQLGQQDQADVLGMVARYLDALM